MAVQRFLTPADVAEVLNISMSQTMALLRTGELEAIKIGGRGQWRVEREKLESYIERMYDQTREFVATHTIADSDPDNGAHELRADELRADDIQAEDIQA